MNVCPSCSSEENVKSGIVSGRQRYRCKGCGYHFTVSKKGKGIDGYYVNKALQLYLEGLSYREIERILGVSHVSVINWVRKYNVKRPSKSKLHPDYEILSGKELSAYFSDPSTIKGAGVIVTELGDKFMLIKWERFRD
jgi:transposase-like protein